MAELASERGTIKVLPFRDDKGNLRVLVLITERRVNRSGKTYNRRISMSMFASEWKRLAREVAPEIEHLEV